MRPIKHAFLNLIRKPSKAVMILVIMVLVFSLVFTGIIIKNSITQSKAFIRNKLGAVVQFMPDWLKASSQELDEEEYKKMSITEVLALDIGSDPRVKKMYLNQFSWLYAPELNSGGKSETTDGNDSSGAYLNITGSNNPIPIDFELDKLKLVSGRHMTNEELNNGEKTMLISEEFAAINNLSAGDMLKLEMGDKSKVEFKVIGIYSGAPQFTKDNVYTSSKVVEEINSTYEGYKMEGYDTAYFLLNDPLDIEGFVKDNTEKLPSKYTKLSANESEYKKLTKPLELMELITSILIWVIYIAGAMIIISIVTIFIRDRKFEIGLLLSSGESKLKIIFQYVFEIALVAIIAFAISAGTSQLTSRYAGNWIVKNQLIEEKTEENPTEDIIYFGNQTMVADVDIENVADEFDVSVNMATMLDLFLMSMGLMIIAAGAPLLMILRYKPREALLE